MSRITIAPSVPPTPEEIERRRALFDKVMALREKIGPIGIPVTELLREARGEWGVNESRHSRSTTMTAYRPLESPMTRTRIAIPDELRRPATADELARRGAVIDRILALRESIGPLPISTAELVREVRDELEGDDE